MSPRPIIVTCGEPAGIGPELAPQLINAGVPYIWLGDPRHLPEGSHWAEIKSSDDILPIDVLPVLRHNFTALATPGRPDPANAQGVIDVIKRAVKLVMTGHAAGICTLPIHKKALKDGADFSFPGHTEFLGHLSGSAKVVMMLASTTVQPPCRVVPATIHVALSKVPDLLTPELLERVIRITHAGLIHDFGIANPRLSVAGLNPHAGEGGTMGHEEQEWMTRVLEQLKADGIRLEGPLPADTLFHKAARSHYDAVICAYHDQALIPIKTLDFSGGVNVTLGLPFIRTSPDHGTAFDIAGTGKADAASAIAALRMAWDMAQVRGFT